MSEHEKRLQKTLAEFDALPDSAMVKSEVIRRHMDISTTTFWRRVNAGALPRPIGGRINVGDYRRSLDAMRNGK